MRMRCAFLAVVLCAAAAAAVARARDAGRSDAALSATGGARVAVAVDATGRLRETESGGRRLGLRWPGPGGSEFLGGCGFILRFEQGYRAVPTVMEQGAFRPAQPESGAGRKRGARSDGVRDPDAAGAAAAGGLGADAASTREEYAATGRIAFVTHAVSPESHVTITQNHYHWSFGHVRDFIGFTTTLRYAPPRGTTRALRRFEAALVTDFKIGDPNDGARAGNDRFVRPAEGEGLGPGPAPEAIAVAYEPGGPYAAVVIFSATGPGGEALGVSSLLVAAQAGPDSIWAALERALPAVLGEEEEAHRLEAAPKVRETDGVPCGGAENEGDLAIVHRVEVVPELEPGGAVVVEWGLVFGRDRAGLERRVARARETWEGCAGPDGVRARWVVPARKAERVEVEAALTPVWIEGRRRAAAVVALPAEGAEDVEWLSVAGVRVGEFEQLDGRLVTTIEEELVGAGAEFALEGQLTDGTFFTARVTDSDLALFAGENDVAPDRLPDETLRLYPNPFVSNISIHVRLHDPNVFRRGAAAARQAAGSVRIYDVRGRLVRSVLEEELAAGDYFLDWDGTNQAGAPVAPGVYYCKLQIGERSLTKRVILLR